MATTTITENFVQNVEVRGLKFILSFEASSQFEAERLFHAATKFMNACNKEQLTTMRKLYIKQKTLTKAFEVGVTYVSSEEIHSSS